MRSIALWSTANWTTPTGLRCRTPSRCSMKQCASGPSFHWLHMWWWVQWLLEPSSYRSTLLCWATCMQFCTTRTCGRIRTTSILKQISRLQSPVTRSGSCWLVECRALYHSASGSACVSAKRSHDRSCSYSLWDSCSAFALWRVPSTRCRPNISELMASLELQCHINFYLSDAMNDW